MPVASLLEELLEFVDEVVDELGSRAAVEDALKIVARGCGADRQLAVYHATGGDLRQVVDFVVQETEMGLDLGAARGGVNG